MGYALKRAQHALHSTMDGELRDYGLSVSQYACLEILASRPRISNADLARDAFVSRQAMHQLLTGLQATGLVSAVGQGRSQRYALTAEGRTRLRTASSTVAAIEQRMIATLSRRRARAAAPPTKHLRDRARPAQPANVLGEHDQP